MADHRETSPRLDAFNTGEFDSLERIYTADCVVHDSQSAFAPNGAVSTSCAAKSASSAPHLRT